MANQFDGQGPILEPDAYQYLDFLLSFPGDSASQPFDQLAAYPNDEVFAYPPPYADDSTTSFVSGLEVFEPGLSHGGDPTPASSYRAPTCPSSEPPSSSSEGPGVLDRHVAGQSLPPQQPPQQPPPSLPSMPSAVSCDQLLDLQFIGDQHVDAPVSWRPNHFQDDDLYTSLAPAAAEYAGHLPGLPSWDGDISPAGRQPLLSPPRDSFSQTRRTRSLAVPPTVSRLRSDPGVPSSTSSSWPMARGHSMARGRSGNLSEDKRAKVARVRTAKACTHCRIRKVECDLQVPCHRHMHSAALCDRKKLVDVLQGGDSHGTWLLEHDEDVTVNGPSYQPYGGGGPAHAMVTSASFLDGGGLVLQPHAVNRASSWSHHGYGYGYGQSNHIYHALPLASPLSTSRNRPGAVSGAGTGAGAGAGAALWAPVTAYQQHPSPRLLQHASFSTSSQLLPSRPTVSVLSDSVEAHVAGEMAAPGPGTFEAAVQTLVFALRDGPRTWLPARAPSSSSPTSSPFPTSSSHPHPPPPRRAGNKNKRNTLRATTGGSAGRGGSADAPPSARYLLHNVCEMTYWVRLWCAPGGLLRCCRREGGRRRRGDEEVEEARAALARAERLVLEELDGLLVSGIRGIEVPVLACLWQMILLYRQAIVAYSDDLGGACSGGGKMRFGGGIEHVNGARSTAEQLSRLLVIRYAAYFGGASSIVYPKATEPSTSDLLAGHRRIQAAWNNVLALRMRFWAYTDHEIDASSRYSDVLLRTLVIEQDRDMERRRTDKQLRL